MPPIDIDGAECLNTRESAQYLAISPITLLRKIGKYNEQHPDEKIRVFRSVLRTGPKYYRKTDLEKLKDPHIVKCEQEYVYVAGRDTPLVEGKPVLNIEQAAIYLGASRTGLYGILKRHPEIKKRRSVGQERYILVEDLEALKQARTVD